MMQSRFTPSVAGRWTLAASLILAGAACGKKQTLPQLSGLVPSPAIAKPDFTLTTTAGQPYAFRKETAGTVALVYFGYTHCADVCPMHMTNISTALKQLPKGERDSVRMVFISTDPDRDTPQVLRAWLDNFDSSFVGLTGTQAQVNALEPRFGMPTSAKEPTDSAGGYGVGHAAFVLAFAPDDSLRALYPSELPTATWVSDLPKLLSIR